MPDRTARSVRIHQFGGPEVLEIEEVQVGSPGSGEVRLEIHAIGLNRTEVTLRSGRSPAKPALPASIGFEAAGMIDEVGQGVSVWRPGDRVALIPAYNAAQYALYGEYSLAPARSLVAIPVQSDLRRGRSNLGSIRHCMGGTYFGRKSQGWSNRPDLCRLEQCWTGGNPNRKSRWRTPCCTHAYLSKSRAVEWARSRRGHCDRGRGRAEACEGTD